MRELVQNPQYIVFIDELHTLVGAGSAEGSLDAANILKPALSRGEIQCIGATTPAEFRKSIEKDRSLERRFQAVKVPPPSEEEAVSILDGVRERSDAFEDRDRGIYFRGPSLGSASLVDDEEMLMSVEVTRDDIEEVIARWTGIPVMSLKEEETQKLLRIEDELRGRVIAQRPAISALARSIRRSRAGLKNPLRPVGSFLFLGPTGVGKTEVARSLAEFLFGSERSMIRFDMSEFMEKHSVSKLIGSPPGYVGHEEGGQLTERIKRSPYSVLLFDEVEKAHPDIFNILLQVFEDGILTDALG